MRQLEVTCVEVGKLEFDVEHGPADHILPTIAPASTRSLRVPVVPGHKTYSLALSVKEACTVKLAER
jgi:hypothetical protein